MGIDYGSKLLLIPDSSNVYGIVCNYAEEHFDGDFYSALDELGLTSASPWYDAGWSDLDIGVELPRPTYEDLLNQESRWWDELNKAKELLDKLFGEGNPKLYDCQDIY